jgi:tetratricopeptide (TPR) repeat protein
MHDLVAWDATDLLEAVFLSDQSADSLRIRRRHLPAVTVVAMAVLLAPVAVARQDTEAVYSRYRELVLRYRDADTRGAVEALAGWSGEECRSAVSIFRMLVERHDAAAPPYEPRAPHAVPLALHTEAAFLLRRQGHHDRADLHLGLARELMRGWSEHVEGSAVVVSPDRLRRRWLIAVGYYWMTHAFVSRALDWLEEGVERYPSDPELRTAVGSVHELIATAGEADAGSAPGRRSWPNRKSAPRTAGYARALDSYRRALRLKPDLLGARLRLARCEHELGHLDEAMRGLRWVLERAPSRHASFLGHLFLGDTLESDGRLQEAIIEYREAVAIDPNSSSGQLALSHALLQSGDRGGAVTAARAALGGADREDQWLSYLATADEFDNALEELRRAALDPSSRDVP